MMAGKTGATERNNTDRRGLAPRKRDRNNTAKRAETRPGKNFPGGRHMRRVLKNLSARQTAAARDKDQSRKKPGSMKG